MNHKLSAGEKVVVARLGIRNVTEIAQDGSVTIDDEGSPLRLPPEEASRRVRLPATITEAEAAKDAFMSTPEQSLEGKDEYERNKTYESALRGNELKQIAVALRALYGVASAGYPEEHNETVLETAFFGELSYVLGKKPGILKRELRKAANVFSLPDRSKALAKYKRIPDRAEYESIGAFAVEGTLIVGESGGGIRLHALPGVWLTYFRQDEAKPAELIAIHFEHLDKLDGPLTMKGKFGIEGASMAIVEELAMRDRGFRRELDFGEQGVINGFGVQVSLGGDGHGTVAVAESEDKVVAVVATAY